MKLSVVIPVFNAESTIEELIKRLFSALAGIDFEIVMVNDGSWDNTAAICEEMAASYPCIKFISLKKNFGEHNAVLCGLNFTAGQYAVIIDDDLQNPPSEILKLLCEIEKGFDVVYSKYYETKRSFFRRSCSKLNDWLATFLIDKPAQLYLSSFKIIRREVIDEITKYNGPFPYIDGLIILATGNIGSVYVHHAEGLGGGSRYTIPKLLHLHLNMISTPSIKTGKMFIVLALLLAPALIIAIYFGISQLSYHFSPNWAFITFMVMLFSAFQITAVFFIGELVARYWIEQNGTQQWIIAKKTFDRQR